MLRTIFLVLFFVVACVQGIFLLKFYKGAEHSQSDLETERYQRMVAEKNFQEATISIKKLDNQVLDLKRDVDRAELLLEKEKEYSVNLQSKLDRAQEFNQKLRGDLKRTKIELENVARSAVMQ